MQIHRREFLKYCIGSAAALGLPLSVVGKLQNALAADAPLPKVIWLNAANCTGCTVSLANLFSDSGPADVADLLINTIDLAFHPTLMGAAGDLAVAQLLEASQGSYILAIEGGIPRAFNGHTCMLYTNQGHEVTALEAVSSLAQNAACVLAIGTCASYGGIPGGDPNPTDIVSVSAASGVSTINIPGCPSHPDWIVSTIAQLLAGNVPQLDSSSRPANLFGRKIHERCPREDDDEVHTIGLGYGCLEEVGCKGEKTRADCPTRLWNSKTNWCVGAGSICIACTERGFPDNFSPFYELRYSYTNYQKDSHELVVGGGDNGSGGGGGGGGGGAETPRKGSMVPIINLLLK